MRMDLTDDAIASLEWATLDAVAPAEQESVGSWLIPYDNSTIGRATSAVPLRHHDIETSTLTATEARYAQHGLQAAFRIADVPGLVSLTAALTAMGYRATQPTLVQVSDMTPLLALKTSAPVTIDPVVSASWASVYTAKGFDPVDGAHRVQALSRSKHIVYATVSRDGEALAAGTASMSRGWVGIHGMRTVTTARGQGLAASILQGLAQTAVQNQYQRAFLQVEEGNLAALALYRRAGFTTAWRYHYWRKPKGICTP